VILAGIGGSFFHPAATAMVARLYPVGTGRALGLVAMGASVGFFLGPVYTGWRAQYSGWRAPVLELGCLGVFGALLFWALADDDAPPPQEQRPEPVHGKLFPTAALWAFFVATSFCFSLRDFTGSSMGTLGSIFLQQAHGFSLRSTGFALSAIFIMSLISNPLVGTLSDRGRVRWAFMILCVAAATAAIFPHLPKSALIPGFMVYGFFFMASYPVVEAALMESVPDAVRGRVFGFFITVGGLVGNVSHWIIGRWVQQLGPAGSTPSGFYHIYGVLALLILLSLLGLPCLHAIRRREHLDSAPAGAKAASTGELVMHNPEV
jgi:MFS family permease